MAGMAAATVFKKFPSRQLRSWRWLLQAPLSDDAGNPSIQQGGKEHWPGDANRPGQFLFLTHFW
jgi:hypothetical protein